MYVHIFLKHLHILLVLFLWWTLTNIWSYEWLHIYLHFSAEKEKKQVLKFYIVFPRFLFLLNFKLFKNKYFCLFYLLMYLNCLGWCVTSVNYISDWIQLESGLKLGLAATQIYSVSLYDEPSHSFFIFSEVNFF